MKVYDLLPVGEENAISRSDLAALIGLDDRTLRNQIQRERLAGAPILSSNQHSGYFRPANTAETERFIRSMTGRGYEIIAVARAIESTLLDELGQERLPGF